MDAEPSGAYRNVSRKTHPDRGGETEDQTALNNAHDAWEAAKRARRPRGKHGRNQQKQEGAAGPLVSPRRRLEGKQNVAGYRFQSMGVLLTEVPETS